MGCLAEDELLALTRGGGLAAAPAVEAHLGACASCSAVVAALVAEGDDEDGAGRGAWDALAGTTVGPYRLDAQIGAGAMGAVYRAWDARLERQVAVKLIAGIGDARRLDAEARAAAAIAHPNVVAVHDVGDDGGRAYVVSELVDGESLRGVIARGPMPIERVRRLGLELARGLAAAHAAGVVHRDLKPENLIVTAAGVLKILDFGLAKRIDRAGGLDATVPGTVFGTVGYMAPEQARGEPVDARADLFAAGAILYELATGRRAFDGASHAERLTAVLRDTPVIDAATFGALGPVVARCLAKEPAARFQSASDLVWVLEEIERTGNGIGLGRGNGNRVGHGNGDALGNRVGRPSRRAIFLGAGGALAAGAAGFLLGRGARPAVRAARAPALQQLTFRQGRVWNARFARDGASIFYGAAWDDEPLAAHALRLGGGVSRALELPSADVLAVSRTAIAIAIDRRHVDGQCATGRLALAPIDGGVPRVLADDVQEADFAPDDALVAIVRTPHGFRLEWPLGHALVEGRAWLTHPRVSPDGRRVACLRHPHANDDAGELIVVERATGAIAIVSAGWTSLAGVAWSPRGDRLWLTASREGAGNALHAVEARAGGAERLVFQTLGRLRLHDAAGERRLLVSRDVWRLRTMVGGGGGPDVDRSLTEFSLVADLSADGASLLVGELGDRPEVNGVYVVPAAGGPRLRLGPGLPLAWSRRGEHVLAIGWDPAANAPRTARYAARGGERTPVATEPVTRVPWASWLDDRHAVIGGAAGTSPPRLWRLDTAAGGATPLTDEGVHGDGAVDPAARRVAFVDPDGALRLVALDGAAAPPPVAHGLARHVVCGWRDDATVLLRTTTTPVDVFAIDAATGARALHRRLAPPPVGLKAVDAVVLARAADRHAYSYGQELSELFLIDLHDG